MSVDAATAFWSEVEANADLKKEVEALLEATGGVRVPLGEIVRIAKTHGLQIDARDIRTHLESIDAMGELDDSELSAVAGGHTVLNDWIAQARGSSGYTRKNMSIVLCDNSTPED